MDRTVGALARGPVLHPEPLARPRDHGCRHGSRDVRTLARVALVARWSRGRILGSHRRCRRIDGGGCGRARLLPGVLARRPPAIPTPPAAFVEAHVTCDHASTVATLTLAVRDQRMAICRSL